MNVWMAIDAYRCLIIHEGAVSKGAALFFDITLSARESGICVGRISQIGPEVFAGAEQGMA